MRLFGLDGLATAAWTALGFRRRNSKSLPTRRAEAPLAEPQTSQWAESVQREFEFTEDTAPAVLSMTPEWEPPTNPAYSSRRPRSESGSKGLRQ